MFLFSASCSAGTTLLYLAGSVTERSEADWSGPLRSGVLRQNTSQASLNTFLLHVLKLNGSLESQCYVYSKNINLFERSKEK